MPAVADLMHSAVPSAQAEPDADAEGVAMVVELILAIGLPLWLCIKEVMRIRAQRPRQAARPAASTWKPRREAAISAKA